MLGLGLNFKRAGIKPFLPSSVSGLDLWLDASMGITKDGSDAVSQWEDRTGNHIFVQAVGANQPLFTANQINGNPLVAFDGIAGFMREAIAGWLSGSSGGSMFIVAKYVAGINKFIASSDEGGGTMFFAVRTLVSVTDRIALNQRNADVADRPFGDTDLSALTDYYWSIESTGTAYDIRLNGSDDGLTMQSGSDNGDWLADTANRDNITLGGLERNGGPEIFLAKIAEILVYDSKVSASDLALIETYISDKYAI